MRACSTRVGETFHPRIRLVRHANIRVHSMISYPNYKFIFPIKALGMYSRHFGDTALNGSV